MIRIVAASTALAIAASAPGYAQEAPEQVAAAQAAVDARAEPGQRWSFTRTLTRGGESFAAAYDPSRSAEDAWRLVSHAGPDQLSEEMRRAFEGFAREETPDLDSVLGAEAGEERNFDELIGGDLTLVSDDGSDAVYSFTPREDPDGGSGAGAMAEHLEAELTLDSAASMITSVRFFAPEPFKPNPAARITRLDVTLRFGETVPGGPIAIVATDTEVAGSALFRDFNETVSVANSDFARASVEFAPQPAE